MSLEQALNDCTAAIKQLIVVMTTANEAGESFAGEQAEGGKRKRRTKAEMEADAAAAAAAQQTRYWNIPAHSTVYEQKPGEPDCTLPSAVQVTQAEYNALKAQYAAAATGNAPTGTPVAAPAPTTPAASTVSAPVSSAASTPTMVTITAKLQAIHKRDGNAGLMKVLSQFGASKVPELASKDLVAVDAAAEAVLNPQSNDNLFG